MLNLHKAKNYIKEQFDNNGDAGWLEGWIRGYTDGDNYYSKKVEIKRREELLNYLNELKKEKEENRMKKYKMTTFTVAEVIRKLPICSDAMKHLKEWLELDSAEEQIWLNDNPTAAEWAVKNGFVEEIIKHDWSKLKLEFRDNGDVWLKDDNSNKTLIRFAYGTGKVIKFGSAEGGAGHFDKEGKLIIT